MIKTALIVARLGLVVWIQIAIGAVAYGLWNIALKTNGVWGFALIASVIAIVFGELWLSLQLFDVTPTRPVIQPRQPQRGRAQ